MKSTVAALALIFTADALANSQNCTGKVKSILDYPAKCEGHVAFKMESTGNSWLCSLSNNSDAMILTAAATGKTVNARLTLPTDGVCSSISHYTTPAYISVPY